jgi:hypothetical protein
MKLAKGSEDQLKTIAVVAFVVIAATIFYFEYFDTSNPTTPVPTVSAPVASSAAAPSSTFRSSGGANGPAAKVVGTTSASLDPTLHMDAMLVSESVIYSGTGRNIFSANSVPVVPIPNPLGPARPKPTQVAQTLPPQPTGPPPPPPIDLKFFGIATAANGARKAFLLHDDIVYTASAGDVVLRRYKVIVVEAKAIQVEDMQNNNKQILPLLAN